MLTVVDVYIGAMVSLCCKYGEVGTVEALMPYLDQLDICIGNILLRCIYVYIYMPVCNLLNYRYSRSRSD